MSFYTKQDRCDERAGVIITKKLVAEYGHLFDFQPHGIKDKTPDTDGFLRLREKYDVPVKSKVGENLNKTFFFQQKGKSGVNNNSYTCKNKIVDYLIDTNLPTILFVVDIKAGTEKIYWFYPSVVNVEDLKRARGRGYTKVDNLIPLTTSEDVDYLYSYLRNIGVRNEFSECSENVRKAAIDLRDKLSLIGGILYLVGKFGAGEYQDKLNRITGLPKSEIRYIVRLLVKQKVLARRVGLVLFEVESTTKESATQLGESLLEGCLNSLNVDRLKLEIATTEHENILAKLGRLTHPQIDDEVNEVIQNLERLT